MAGGDDDLDDNGLEEPDFDDHEEEGGPRRLGADAAGLMFGMHKSEIKEKTPEELFEGVSSSLNKYSDKFWNKEEFSVEQEYPRVKKKESELFNEFKRKCNNIQQKFRELKGSLDEVEKKLDGLKKEPQNEEIKNEYSKCLDSFNKIENALAALEREIDAEKNKLKSKEECFEFKEHQIKERQKEQDNAEKTSEEWERSSEEEKKNLEEAKKERKAQREKQKAEGKNKAFQGIDLSAVTKMLQGKTGPTTAPETEEQKQARLQEGEKRKAQGKANDDKYKNIAGLFGDRAKNIKPKNFKQVMQSPSDKLQNQNSEGGAAQSAPPPPPPGLPGSPPPPAPPMGGIPNAPPMGSAKSAGGPSPAPPLKLDKDGKPVLNAKGNETKQPKPTTPEAGGTQKASQLPKIQGDRAALNEAIRSFGNKSNKGSDKGAADEVAGDSEAEVKAKADKPANETADASKDAESDKPQERGAEVDAPESEPESEPGPATAAAEDAEIKQQAELKAKEAEIKAQEELKAKQEEEEKLAAEKAQQKAEAEKAEEENPKSEKDKVLDELDDFIDEIFKDEVFEIDGGNKGKLKEIAGNIKEILNKDSPDEDDIEKLSSLKGELDKKILRFLFHLEKKEVGDNFGTKIQELSNKYEKSLKDSLSSLIKGVEAPLPPPDEPPPPPMPDDDDLPLPPPSDGPHPGLSLLQAALKDRDDWINQQSEPAKTILKEIAQIEDYMYVLRSDLDNYKDGLAFAKLEEALAKKEEELKAKEVEYSKLDDGVKSEFKARSDVVELARNQDLRTKGIEAKKQYFQEIKKNEPPFPDIEEVESPYNENMQKIMEDQRVWIRGKNEGDKKALYELQGIDAEIFNLVKNPANYEDLDAIKGLDEKVGALREKFNKVYDSLSSDEVKQEFVENYQNMQVFVGIVENGFKPKRDELEEKAKAEAEAKAKAEARAKAEERAKEEKEKAIKGAPKIGTLKGSAHNSMYEALMGRREWIDVQEASDIKELYKIESLQIELYKLLKERASTSSPARAEELDKRIQNLESQISSDISKLNTVVKKGYKYEGGKKESVDRILEKEKENASKNVIIETKSPTEVPELPLKVSPKIKWQLRKSKNFLQTAIQQLERSQGIERHIGTRIAEIDKFLKDPKGHFGTMTEEQQKVRIKELEEEKKNLEGVQKDLGACNDAWKQRVEKFFTDLKNDIDNKATADEIKAHREEFSSYHDKHLSVSEGIINDSGELTAELVNNFDEKHYQTKKVFRKGKQGFAKALDKVREETAKLVEQIDETQEQVKKDEAALSGLNKDLGILEKRAEDSVNLSEGMQKLEDKAVLKASGKVLDDALDEGAKRKFIKDAKKELIEQTSKTESEKINKALEEIDNHLKDAKGEGANALNAQKKVLQQDLQDLKRAALDHHLKEQLETEEYRDLSEFKKQQAQAALQKSNPDYAQKAKERDDLDARATQLQSTLADLRYGRQRALLGDDEQIDGLFKLEAKYEGYKRLKDVTNQLENGKGNVIELVNQLTNPEVTVDLDGKGEKKRNFKELQQELEKANQELQELKDKHGVSSPGELAQMVAPELEQLEVEVKQRIEFLNISYDALIKGFASDKENVSALEFVEAHKKLMDFDFKASASLDGGNSLQAEFDGLVKDYQEKYQNLDEISNTRLNAVKDETTIAYKMNEALTLKLDMAEKVKQVRDFQQAFEKRGGLDFAIAANAPFKDFSDEERSKLNDLKNPAISKEEKKEIIDEVLKKKQKELEAELEKQMNHLDFINQQNALLAQQAQAAVPKTNKDMSLDSNVSKEKEDFDFKEVKVNMNSWKEWAASIVENIIAMLDALQKLYKHYVHDAYGFKADAKAERELKRERKASKKGAKGEGKDMGQDEKNAEIHNINQRRQALESGLNEKTLSNAPHLAERLNGVKSNYTSMSKTNVPTPGATSGSSEKKSKAKAMLYYMKKKVTPSDGTLGKLGRGVDFVAEAGHAAANLAHAALKIGGP